MTGDETRDDGSQHRRVEKELRGSEQHLRALFESIDEGYCLAEIVTDVQGQAADYRFVEVNAAFEDMTGLVAAVGRTALELVPDLEPEWVRTYGRVGLGRETLRFEQGSAAMGRWFDVFAVPVEPAPHFAIVFTDQTQKHRTEDALRESEARFRAMADGLPLLVWQHGPDGAQEWVNQTFCDFFGVRREEMLAARWQALVDPETGSDYAEAFQAAVRDATAFRGQVRARDAAGRWRWLQSWADPRYSAGGDYLGHLGVSADVTDRVAAEETLHRNHAFVSELTALVPGLLYVFDLEQRRNVFVNAAAHEALGYTPEEITGLGDQFLPSVLHPDDSDQFTAHLSRLPDLPDGQAATLEYRLEHRQRGWRWFATRDVILSRDELGRPRQVLGIATDVTETKAAEAAARADAVLDGYRAALLDSLRPVNDPAQIPPLACRLLGEHLGASGVQYVHVRQDGQTCVVEAGYAAADVQMAGTFRLDRSGDGVAHELRAGHTVCVDDVSDEDRLSPDERLTAISLGIHAGVISPLTSEPDGLSALVVHQDSPRAWTPHELVVIEITASRTRAALDQACAYQASRTAHRRAELVADVIGVLEAEAAPAQQLQRLAEVLVPSLGDYATIEAPGSQDPVRGLAHRDSHKERVLRELRNRHRVPADAAGSVSQAAAGQPHLIAETSGALISECAVQPETARLLADLGPRSHMAVPLHLGEDSPGVLMVGVTDPDRPLYTPEDLGFLQEVAHRAEVILAATRLRRTEHDIAVRLQRAMLPDHLIQHPRLRVAARYQAAGDMLEVGGDWYDTVVWPSGHIGVMVGDVVGHNLESAAAMGRLRAATAAIAAHVRPDPADLLDAVNQFAAGRNGTEFATAACLVIDPTSGRLVYSSAGHPPALLLDPSGASAWLDDAQHPPLATHTSAHASATRALTSGSVVVLYSDGLVERRGEVIDVGLNRLQIVASAAAHLSPDPDAMAERLLRDLTVDSPTDDDVVVVCVQYRSTEAVSA